MIDADKAARWIAFGLFVAVVFNLFMLAASSTVVSP